MCKQITLTNGATAVVDDEDYGLVSKYKWASQRGYAKTIVYEKRKGKSLFMHRLVMGNPPSNLDIDHINHDKIDNRKCNLRVCNRTLHHANRTKLKSFKGKKCTSKYKGVSYRKDHKKWEARITYKLQRIHIGYYDTEEQAAIAYNGRAKELYGEFAHLNQIPAQFHIKMMELAKK
jgi:hypothetical protein